MTQIKKFVSERCILLAAIDVDTIYRCTKRQIYREQRDINTLPYFYKEWSTPQLWVPTM